jgi:hypothetical protein
MEFDDFKQFMDAAQTTFPSLKKWLGQQSADNRKATWKSWRKTLGGVSLDSGLSAIDKMLANAKLQPYGDKWEQFPGKLLELTVGTSHRPKGVRKCICGGDGMVMVGLKFQGMTFDGNPLKQFQKGDQTLSGPICAACLCPMGVWVNDCRRKKVDPAMGPRLLPEYDPRRMVIVNGTDDLFAPAIAERERLSMSQAMIDFDRMPAGSLDGDFQ